MATPTRRLQALYEEQDAMLATRPSYFGVNADYAALLAEIEAAEAEARES